MVMNEPFIIFVLGEAQKPLGTEQIGEVPRPLGVRMPSPNGIVVDDFVDAAPHRD